VVTTDLPPNLLRATLVRSGLVRASAADRPWLEHELATSAARRQTALAAVLPKALAVSVTLVVVDALTSLGTPIWLDLVALLLVALVGVLGLGRHARPTCSGPRTSCSAARRQTP
jgi:hypothetical protein